MNLPQKNENSTNNGKGVGRGRGWLKMNDAPVHETLMKSPGGLQELNVNDASDNDENEQQVVGRMIDIIDQTVDLYDGKKSMLSMPSGQKEFDQLYLNLTEPQNIFKKLHEHALANTAFALKYVVFNCLYVKHSTTSVQPTDRHFITNCQNSHESMDAIYESNERQLHNAILMLVCWVLSRRRIIFCKPIAKYFTNTLLRPPLTESGCRLFAKLFARICRISNEPDVWHGCVVQVHKVLGDVSDAEVTGGARKWLALALECRGRTIEKPIFDYYASVFGKQEMSFFEDDSHNENGDVKFVQTVVRYFKSESALHDREFNAKMANDESQQEQQHQQLAEKSKSKLQQGRPILGVGMSAK